MKTFTKIKLLALFSLALPSNAQTQKGSLHIGVKTGLAINKAHELLPANQTYQLGPTLSYFLWNNFAVEGGVFYHRLNGERDDRTYASTANGLGYHVGFKQYFAITPKFQFLAAGQFSHIKIKKFKTVMEQPFVNAVEPKTERHLDLNAGLAFFPTPKINIEFCTLVIGNSSYSFDYIDSDTVDKTGDDFFVNGFNYFRPTLAFTYVF